MNKYCLCGKVNYLYKLINQGNASVDAQGNDPRSTKLKCEEIEVKLGGGA